MTGYLLSRWKFVPGNAQAVLSKLENYVFIPALVLGTFMDNFTVQTITVAWKLLLGSLTLALIAAALALLLARVCTKDAYVRDIYTYGLCFSNFGFVGNAVVSALFPDIFLEYLIFTLPLWTLIYLWGVPVLLMGSSGEKPSLAQRMKNFVNPMFVCMLIGMMIGLLDLPVPAFFGTAVASAGSCMSPMAMLLTGMTIAQFRLGEILKIKSVYLVTALRLILFPALFLAAMTVIPFQRTFAVCAICSLCMPLGLNTIIIPSALGRDTKIASGMAVVSHPLCCITIPVVLSVFEQLI